MSIRSMAAASVEQLQGVLIVTAVVIPLVCQWKD
jgi:hypothetical protein